MNEYIKSDLKRYCGKTDNLSFVRTYLRNRAFRFQCALRLRQSTGLPKLFSILLWAFNSTRKTIQIPVEAQIGYGLYIGHGGPVIVNPTAVIGSNCNFSPFTVIGSNHNRAAVIGDNVYIGPNVCIVENVRIGSNVTIGAGSVVTKDIPDNATAAGNYAKVVNYSNPGRYIGNRWPVEDR